MDINAANRLQQAIQPQGSAINNIARGPAQFEADRPTLAEYLAWRDQVLSTPDYAGDPTGAVLPRRAEIRWALSAAH